MAAITVEQRAELVALFLTMFGKAPTTLQLARMVTARENGTSLQNIATSASVILESDFALVASMDATSFATYLTNALLASDVPAAAREWATNWVITQVQGNKTKAQVIVEAVQAIRATTNPNYASSQAELAADVTATLNVINTPPPATFNFTTGVDNFTGTIGSDTFTAADVAGVAAWTTGDAINGGAGTDTFYVVSNAAITVPTAATVTGIETAYLTSGGAITANTSTWTGLTSLTTTTSGAAQTLTAAATTDVNVIANAQAATNVGVDGGNNVTITGTGTTTGTTTVGATTAASGNVVVSVTNSTGGTTTGTIAVTGGDTITVTSAAANAVNTTVTQSTVNITGDAQTTAVTVNQDKAATAGATVVGKVAGAVTINDVNNASTTAAGTIATVSLKSYGNSTINSGALTTLNLAGSGGTLGVTAGSLTTPAVSTLALNVNGLSGGAVTLDADYTTLNIAGSTAASTIANVTGTGVTTINVSGDAAVTLTDNTFAALTSVVVTNTAGATFGTTALGTGVTFTGGAGADKISIGSTTKAITMGAGNDTVTTSSAAVGTGGSVAAGDGTDTIIMTDALAAGADGSSTFNSKFTGFEVLQISDAFVEDALDVEGLNNVSKVILAAGVSGTAGINNIASGGTVQINADGAATPALTVGVRSALVGGSDSLTIKLQGSDIDAGSVTVANVETINLDTADATPAAANAGTITLVATSATSLVVSGNNGLNITNTGNTAITKFDASGVVANNTATTTDTAAELGVTFTSANVTSTATVTITGGAGNDTLTGAAAKDTINGGAGADLLNGGTNTDAITVGNGRDIVQVTNNDDDTAGDIIGSGTGTMDSITGFGLVGTAITAVDLSSNANFQASTAGGANLSLLNLDLTADDAGAGAGTNLALAVEANGTGSGQAAGVSYTVTNGILSLSGVGATNVDTLGEWLTEAAAVAATAGDVLAFQFGSDTYVFAQNGTADVLVQLVGVAGTSLVEVSGATTASAGAILYADL